MNLPSLKKDPEDSLNKKLWLYIDTGACDGPFNMSCDKFLLNKLVEGQISLPVLRTYAWNKPTLSIGVNQLKREEVTNLNFKFPIVKRITGGQAVLHDLLDNELTYSICLPSRYKFKELYYEIGKILIFFLERYRLKGSMGYSDKDYLSHFDCFDSKTSADIVVNDIKVIGSAQCRKKGFILQHGSIRLDKVRKLSGNEVFYEQAARNLKSSFETKFNINFQDYSFTREDYERINHEKVFI